MKTAMQEMILNIEAIEAITTDQEQIYMLTALKMGALVFLKKEKEQLNVSFISGAIEALSSSTPVRDRIKDGYFENKAEQYFEYTYKTNNNERK